MFDRAVLPPAMLTEPVVTPVAHWMNPSERPAPMMMLSACSVLVPLPRLRMLLLELLFVPPPVSPGVGPLLSPTSIVPAVMELLTARFIVALALLPTPTRNSFPPLVTDAGFVPVVKLKLARPLMSSTGAINAVLVLFPLWPTTKLE